MKFEKLYKLTVTKKIQEWQIETFHNIIIVKQGQIGGKQQVYEEIIHDGKNLGKANETTPAEQADAEAQSKWEHKRNKDYHLTIAEAQQKGKTANLGGYLPMLAQSYVKHAEKHLRYPCYVQPKLDGLRCIATKTEEGVKLWFRSGKEITTMDHIVKELEHIMFPCDIFDGELYIHSEDFNNFTGAIRANKSTNPEATKKIKYHMYDFPRINHQHEDNSFITRLQASRGLNVLSFGDSLVLVDTIRIDDHKEAMEYYKHIISQGYEGIMFRNIESPYEQKRSYNLLKYKEFIEDEFIIIGAEEGKGSLAGHVGSFICKIEAGRTLLDIGGERVLSNTEGQVKAKMDGKRERLKYLFEHPEEYMNKPLTIKYQNLSKEAIPRFPIGKAIRFDK